MSERIIYKHVVVIGIDGIGNFNAKAETPNIDRIFENSAKTFSGLSMDPTISAENWGSMLLGAEPVVHGLTNSILNQHDHKSDILPSLFKRIKTHIPNATLASYCNWTPINNGLIEKDLDVDKYTNGNDAELTTKVTKCIENKPTFLFVHLDEGDGAGHRYGYGSKEHLEKITYEDEQVGRIFNAYEKAGIIDDTLFIVLSDHGGYERSHGGYSDTEKYIFFGARGKGIKKSKIGDMRTIDLYAIVLYAFGIDIPNYDINGFSSQIPKGIFSEYKGNYIKIVGKPFNPQTKPTPEIRSEKGLLSFISKEKIKLALFFDNNYEDAFSTSTPTECGTVKFYSDGVRGACTELGNNGHLIFDDIKFGNESITFSVWLKINRELIDEPAVFANKNWSGKRCTKGILLALRCSNTALNIGCGDDDFDFVTPFPPEISTGWVHGIFVIDKDNRKVQTYYNFKLCHETTLEPQYLTELDNMPFTVGNDGLGTYNNEIKQIFNIDDLFIFKGAFKEEDIRALKDYYEL
ncbi:MAG: alkaline phosphatase family protein [Clostridia bacterium]|nr:alkaline phosphatase family protein [Clostridia bacterium]